MTRYLNHLGSGYKEIIFKNKPTVSSLNSGDFETALAQLDSVSARIGVIPPSYEHRADKIAELFYGSPALDWLVLWSNNISDPFEQLNAGDRIRILSI